MAPLQLGRCVGPSQRSAATWYMGTWGHGLGILCDVDITGKCFALCVCVGGVEMK